MRSARSTRRHAGTWTQLSHGADPAAPPKVLAGGLALSPVDGSVIVIAGSPAAGRQGSSWRWANGVWTAERVPAVATLRRAALALGQPRADRRADARDQAPSAASARPRFSRARAS